MLTLKADNRQLTKNAKFSFLSTNYNSGVSSLVITNSNGFAADDYVLISEFGSESTEVVQIDSVNTSTHTLTLKAATKFAHSQDTKLAIIKYNQVRFYHTTDTTFSATDPVTAYIDIQADDFFSRAYDTTNTTGYGWFVFYNSTTTTATTESNYIPYTNFSENTVKEIFNFFFSLLNNKELKLISNDEAFKWLNEAYSIAVNELNLVNRGYKVTAEDTITTTASTQEYALESDFSQLVSVTNAYGDPIPFIPLEAVPKSDYLGGYSETAVSYFLRGSYIGFTPVPNAADTYYLYYKAKSTALSAYSDSVTLPDNNFYLLVDHMIYRAAMKLGRVNPNQYEEAFIAGMNRMKVTSHKQNANRDSWQISASANV